MRERIAKGDLLAPTLYTASPWLHAGVAGTATQARQVTSDHKTAGYDLIKLGSISHAAYAAIAEKARKIGMTFGGHIPEEVGLATALSARQVSIDHLDRYVESLVPHGAATNDIERGFFWQRLGPSCRRAEFPRRYASRFDLARGLSLVEHLASQEQPEDMLKWPEMKYMPRSVLQRWVGAIASATGAT